MAEKMIYLAKKDGKVVAHADKQAMFDLDGIEEPDMTVSEEEFYAAGGLVRIIDGAIVLGKTAAEKAEEKRLEEIKACKQGLDAIDQKAGAGRAVRASVIAVADAIGINIMDADLLREWENEAVEIRERMKALTAVEIQPALPEK